MKGDRTRAAIVERAVDIASVEGLEGLTIGRLADALKMSKSGVFAHFGSKEDLQIATVEAARQRFVNEVFRPALKSERGYPRLIEICRAWLDYVGGDVFPGGCFFAAASFEFDGRTGPVRDAVQHMMDDWMAAIQKAVELAQAEGHLDPDVEAAQLSFEINALFFGANFAHNMWHDRKAIERAKIAIEHRLESLRLDNAAPAVEAEPPAREKPVRRAEFID